MSLMLKHFLSMHDTLKSITQKIFVSGHSFNACDRSFAIIERAKKFADNIFIPDRWMELVREAKKNEPTFAVIKMNSEDFYSSSELEKCIVNRKKDVHKNKINWFDIRTIKYRKDSLFTLFINFNIRVNIKKNSVDETSFMHCEIPLLYPDGKLINEKKYKDLLDLLNYIPKEYHSFYKDLKYHSKEIDYGLASDDEYYDDSQNDEIN